MCGTLALIIPSSVALSVDQKELLDSQWFQSLVSPLRCRGPDKVSVEIIDIPSLPWTLVMVETVLCMRGTHELDNTLLKGSDKSFFIYNGEFYDVDDSHQLKMTHKEPSNIVLNVRRLIESNDNLNDKQVLSSLLDFKTLASGHILNESRTLDDYNASIESMRDVLIDRGRGEYSILALDGNHILRIFRDILARKSLIATSVGFETHDNGYIIHYNSLETPLESINLDIKYGILMTSSLGIPNHLVELTDNKFVYKTGTEFDIENSYKYTEIFGGEWIVDYLEDASLYTHSSECLLTPDKSFCIRRPENISNYMYNIVERVKVASNFSSDMLCSIPPSFDASLIKSYTMENALQSLFDLSIKEEYASYNSLVLSPFLKLMNQSISRRLKDLPFISYGNTDYAALLDSQMLRLDIKSFIVGKGKISIMFSGGIDCFLIALLAHHNLISQPDIEIDLLNVAFLTPRLVKSKTQYKFWTPDRITGWKRFKELSRLYPSRTFNFVMINVCSDEQVYKYFSDQLGSDTYYMVHTMGVKNEVDDYCKRLLLPRNTELDRSIGLAFWYASLGIGSSISSKNMTKELTKTFSSVEEEEMILNKVISIKYYISGARIVLSGLGADELFGGYSHHRVAYIGYGKNKKTKKVVNSIIEIEQEDDDDDESIKMARLAESLMDDLKRLPLRNLVRDDRMVTSHGRELRVPFVDEDVVIFASKLPIEGRLRPRLLEIDAADGTVAVAGKTLVRAAAASVVLSDVETLSAGLAEPIKATDMCTAMVEPKRAAQFGARTAKMAIGSRNARAVDLL